MGAAERILQFVDYKGFVEGKKGKSIRSFYNEVGLSNGSIKAGRSIGTDALSKIFDKYPELNQDWVVTGRGEMEYKEPQMIVGVDSEAAKIAIDALKEELLEARLDLIKCLKQKEGLVAGYKQITLNEPAAKEPGK